MIAQDALHDGEPQAGTVLAAGEEGVEDLRQDLGRDARAGIRDTYGDHVTLRPRLHVEPHGERTPARHGLHAVHHEVQEDLLDLARVGFDERQSLRALDLDVHAKLLELEAQEQRRVLGGLTQVEGAECPRLGLAHAEHARDHALHVGDLFTHHAKVLHLRIVGEHTLRERIGQEFHDRERVANLVRDLGGQETQGGQAFAATEPLFDREDLSVEARVLD